MTNLDAADNTSGFSCRRNRRVRGRALIADRGYDSNWFRNELAARGIASYIPGRKNRKQAIDYDKALYKQRHKVENNLPSLKTGGASQHVSTDAPTHSSQPSTSVAFYVKE